MRYFVGLWIAMASSTQALAGGPFVTIGGEVGQTETQSPTRTYTASALNGRLGYDFGKYFGIEAEGAIHLGSSATETGQVERITNEFEREVKSRYGVFLRGRIPVSERVSVFGRAGLGARNETDTFRSFGIFEFNGNMFDETRVRDESNIYGAFGLGAEFQVSDDVRNAIRADFTRYNTYIGGEDQDEDYANDSVFSLAYVRRF